MDGRFAPRGAFWMAAFLAACMPTITSGQDTAEEIRVASLITRLGSESYLERQEATQQLAEMGIVGRQQLEAATEHEDPEVRLRARQLLREIKTDELWAASKVSFIEPQRSSQTALKAIAEQTGNRILLGDQYGSFSDKPIELASQQGEFWPIIDEICRQSGNRVRPHYDTRNPGLVVVGGSAGDYPGAYSGPIRAQITSARRVFSEELDYEDHSSEVAHSFQLNLQMTWEDRFRLVAYRSQPELVTAITNTGVELSATQPAGSGWNVAGAGTRQLTMNLRLHPPSTEAIRLDRMVLRWGLIAVGDMATLSVTNLETPDTYFQDDVEMRVDSIQHGPGARCEVSVSILRDLILPDPQEIIFQESELELVDAEGKAWRRQGQSNSIVDGQARIKATYVGDSASSTPQCLRLRYPRIRAEKSLEIEFRDVALPVARPQ